MADPRRRVRASEAMSLDEQIALAEMQVVARDARIRHRTQGLVRRVKLEAIRHAGGGALLGLGGVALAWWLSHLSRRNAPPAPPAAAPADAPSHGFEHLFRDAGLTLAGLLPILWPLLPRAWRRLVTPATASTLVTFLAPLLGRLFRRGPPRAPSS
jgi:uncharacterized protein YjeT (DUF2065 family)